MNLSEILDLPPRSLAVRVGCNLAYCVNDAALALLMVQARPGCNQAILSESLSVGPQEKIAPLLDAHGNAVLQTVLEPGSTLVQYDAIVTVPYSADPPEPGCGRGGETTLLPIEILRYALPSRYCESDKLGGLASRLFGHYPKGLATAQAICAWTHRNLEYRYGSGDATLSACGAIRRGYGVCRDFAHVMVALCRALDMPTRYVAGYMPLLEATDTDIGIDFHAYVEVYIDRAWHIFDPRHNRPHIGRIKIAHGMDAVDVAFATIYGRVATELFQVWSYPVDQSTVKVGDPVLMPVHSMAP
nr:transglutaminase family protein [uncultured Noviherbaspirillum sp.]